MTNRLPIQNPLPAGLATGGNVSAAAVDPYATDEISAQILRLKRADERLRSPVTARPAATPAAAQWAEDWNLPREVHEYFILEVA